MVVLEICTGRCQQSGGQPLQSFLGIEPAQPGPAVMASQTSCLPLSGWVEVIGEVQSSCGLSLLWRQRRQMTSTTADRAHSKVE